MFIPENTTFTAAFSPNLLSGVELIKGNACGTGFSRWQIGSNRFTAVHSHSLLCVGQPRQRRNDVVVSAKIKEVDLVAGQ